MTNPKFKLGQLTMTCGVAEWANGDLMKSADIGHCIFKHERGDWGEVCASDAALNDEALLVGNRTLSVYTVAGRKIYITTEWDRSVTTLLFPEEY
jgi:hypothetical protein